MPVVHKPITPEIIMTRPIYAHSLPDQPKKKWHVNSGRGKNKNTIKYGEAVQFLAHYRESDGSEQSVKEHLEAVSAKAGEFTEKVGLKSMGELIGLLHDLGKYSNEFQAYIKSAVGKINPDEDEYIDANVMKGKIDHSTAGAQFLWNVLQNRSQDWNLAVQIMALCIVSHHSGLIDCLTPDGTDLFTSRMEKSKERTHIDEVSKKADENIQKYVHKLLSSSVIQEELLRRLKSLASCTESKETSGFELGLLIRFIFSSLIDADRLDSADFADQVAARKRYNDGYPKWELLIKKFEKHIFGFAKRNRIDDIRAEVSLSCREFASRESGVF